MLQKEFTSYLGAVFSKFDYPVIHGLHGIVIDEIVQAGENFCDFRIFFQRIAIDDGEHVVGREELFVVLQQDQIVFLKQSVGGEGSDHIHLAGGDGGIHQGAGEIVGGFKLQSVHSLDAGKSVLPNSKFRRASQTELSGYADQVGHLFQTVLFCGLPGDGQHVGVVESEAV